jgi:hypothetical protein
VGRKSEMTAPSALNPQAIDRTAPKCVRSWPVDTPQFRIGSSDRAHVIVSPTHRSWPEATNYSDSNIVDATVEVAAGSFRGQFDAVFWTDQFVGFRDQLVPLDQKLVGRAKFDPLEDWLSIEVEGDGKGHFRAKCIARDYPGTGNLLTFDIDFDQTELPAILRGLNAICEAFPVVGKP